MTFEAENILQLIFAFQAAFFGLLSLASKRLRSFAGLLFAFAFHMTFNLLAETGNLGPLPNITSAFVFAYGPLIYLFVRDITQALPKAKIADVVHVLPFVASIPFSPSNLTFDMLGLVSITAYFAYTIRYVKRYNASIANSQPDQFSAKLNWLSKALAAFVVLAGYDVGRIFLARVYPVFLGDAFYLVTLLGAFAVINWLIFKTFRFKDLFSGLTESELGLVRDTKEASLAPLSSEDRSIAEAALGILHDKMLYLNPNFRLEHFSVATDVDARRLSLLVRQHTGDRFPLVVNKLRVTYAQELISAAKPGNCNFLMISYDAGFNSKSSFNQVFKQISGLTPSAYRESSPD
ncbi:MAG: helix-turn-helix domain-containing protein [Kordiimonadaceae bacterium]|nr:helix-turn-helix domain-containing protein [Kordiimonadaceae bacterium]